MKDLLERLLDEAEGETGTSPASASAEASSGGGSMPADLISRILGNVAGSAANGQVAATPHSPEIDGAPPVGGSAASNNATGRAGGEGGASAASLLQTLSALGPLLGGGGEKRGGVPDRHTALLCALKPYLSRDRQQAADTLLRLCRIWDVLSRSGLSMGGILNGLNLFGGRLGADASKTDAEDKAEQKDPADGSGR